MAYRPPGAQQPHGMHVLSSSRISLTPSYRCPCVVVVVVVQDRETILFHTMPQVALDVRMLVVRGALFASMSWTETETYPRSNMPLRQRSHHRTLRSIQRSETLDRLTDIHRDWYNARRCSRHVPPSVLPALRHIQMVPPKCTPLHRYVAFFPAVNALTLSSLTAPWLRLMHNFSTPTVKTVHLCEYRGYLREAPSYLRMKRHAYLDVRGLCGTNRRSNEP